MRAACRSGSLLVPSIYLHDGSWWLKRYQRERALPWQACEGTSEQRPRLVGIKMPDRDLHMSDPTAAGSRR